MDLKNFSVCPTWVDLKKRQQFPRSYHLKRKEVRMKLLRLVMWKCVYDRIVYLNIVKKGINIFSKKGGHNVAKGGAHNFSHPPTQMLSYAPGDVPLKMEGYLK